MVLNPSDGTLFPTATTEAGVSARGARISLPDQGRAMANGSRRAASLKALSTP